MTSSISSSVGTISSAGVGSGLDVESIVTKLMAIEKQPITQLQTQETALQAQLSSYGQIQSALSAFNDAASKLADPASWSPSTATSSNPSAVQAVAGGATPVGHYQVSVTQLAASQTTVGAATYAATTDSVGQGTIHIELGSWSADRSSFAPSTTASAVDVTIPAGGDSLQAVRDAINNAKAGVTASIVTDSSGSRLVMRSTQSGAQNGFRISVSDADGNNTDAHGLSALAYDAAAGVNSGSLTQAAADAKATINGIAVSSATNQLASIIDGMSLTLGATTASPADIGVARDNDTITKSVNNFVSAYNNIVTLIKSQTKADPGKSASPLTGDSTATGLLSALRSMVGSSSGASTVFSRLSNVGIQFQTDGTLKLDSTVFTSALGQIGELTRLFTNTDATTPANNGMAVRLQDFATQMLKLGGPLQNHTDSIKTRITANEDRQSALTDQAALTEKRLRAQYTALDTAMAQLQSQQTYINQMITSMNASKSG